MNYHYPKFHFRHHFNLPFGYFCSFTLHQHICFYFNLHQLTSDSSATICSSILNLLQYPYNVFRLLFVSNNSASKLLRLLAAKTELFSMLYISLSLLLIFIITNYAHLQPISCSKCRNFLYC